MKKITLTIAIAFSVITGLAAEPETKKIGWFEPVVKDIEGWKVSVDPKLLEGEHAKEGELALKMLANHLQRIIILMPEKQLADMQKIGIWLEHKHPELGNMQYHPGKDWLVQKGYHPDLVKKVHIPVASALYSKSYMLKQPAVILHELAHGYHDQVLSFENPKVLAAFDAAVKLGNYEKVMLFNGKETKHYALTNHKEYFAEATEAFLYRNDFYPFVSAELKVHDPKAHELMEQIWQASAPSK
ncbi:MAG: metallopeptidase [Verrucomicrobiota bacterium]